MVRVGVGNSWRSVGQRKKKPTCPLFHCRLQTKTSQDGMGRRYNTKSDLALRFISGSGHIRIFKLRLWF